LQAQSSEFKPQSYKKKKKKQKKNLAERVDPSEAPTPAIEVV
jgi:hypothetical protein